MENISFEPSHTLVLTLKSNEDYIEWSLALTQKKDIPVRFNQLSQIMKLCQILQAY